MFVEGSVITFVIIVMTARISYTAPFVPLKTQCSQAKAFTRVHRQTRAWHVKQLSVNKTNLPLGTYPPCGSTKYKANSMLRPREKQLEQIRMLSASDTRCRWQRRQRLETGRRWLFHTSVSDYITYILFVTKTRVWRSGSRKPIFTLGGI